jgi:hypothetical protein
MALGYEVIDEMPVSGVFAKGMVKESLRTLQDAEALGSKLAVLVEDLQ